MSAQFTPGPWHAAPKSLKTWNFGIYDEGGTEVAHVAAHALNFLRREDDARLIAAAPDLLAAAECNLALDMDNVDEGIAILTRHGFTNNGFGRDVHSHAWATEFVRTLTRNAYAKATGSAP